MTARLKVKGELKKCSDCQTDKILSFYHAFENCPMFVHHENKYYCVACGEKYTGKVNYLSDYKIENK